MHTGGLVSMFGHVGCAHVRSVGMGPRAHLEQSPCRRALLTARSFSRGLVPGSDHSFVNFRANGMIEVPLESSTVTGTCPRPSVLLVVPRCPPAQFQDRPAGATLFENRRLFEFGRTCHGRQPINQQLHCRQTAAKQPPDSNQSRRQQEAVA